jgi:hypothetical protein
MHDALVAAIIRSVRVHIDEEDFKFTDALGKTVDILSKPAEAKWFPSFTHQVENVIGSP